MTPTRSRDAHPIQAGMSRRDFVRTGAVSALGLAAAGRSSGARAGDAPCQSVILLWMQGGVSHLDTFDPKPGASAEVRGPFAAIPTNVPGIQLCEHLPRLARVAGQIAFIRSMHHPEGAHERGMSYVLTGCRPETAVSHPSIGAIIAKEIGPRRGAPPYVAVHGSSFAAALGCLGSGYLESSHDPLALDGDASASTFRVRDMALPQEAVVERAVRRAPGGSTRLQASLDIALEPAKVRDAYGRSSLGRKCLLARRLVEAGSRFVVVDEDGWDHHFRAFDALKNRLPAFDQAVAALIADLADRGLLDSTMVVFLTEFGRSPRINYEAGREHHPGVFSCFLAGGGIRGGQAIGASDARGESPAGQPVTPEDLFRTIYAQLGIASHKRYVSTALGRPMPILDGGQLIRGLV